MAQVSARTRPLLILGAAVLAAAVVVLVVVGTVLPLTAGDEAPAVARPTHERAVTAREMLAAARLATQALRARDAAAWAAALPAAGRARRSAESLYRHLVRLPWTNVRILAEPVDAHPGRFYIGAVGELAGTDPPDRIMARRVYDIVARDGHPALRADVTPKDLRGQQVMAFEKPVVIRRNGLVVIADKAEQVAAEELARAGGPARQRLKLLGLTSRKPVVVYYYASRGEMLRSLGDDPGGESRVRFFSHPPVHLDHAQTWTRDVGVLGPALAGNESWAPQMLAHELTHAYTTSWFADAKHAPTLLAEGLATAVEGGRSFQPLRDDLAAAASAFPLEKALRAESLWRGNATAKVRLAYLEGASLVLYVLDHWDLLRLKEFVRAVSDSDLSGKGLDAAAQQSLGVSWAELRSGWESYARTLP